MAVTPFFSNSPPQSFNKVPIKMYNIFCGTSPSRWTKLVPGVNWPSVGCRNLPRWVYLEGFSLCSRWSQGNFRNKFVILNNNVDEKIIYKNIAINNSLKKKKNKRDRNIILTKLVILSLFSETLNCLHVIHNY